MSSPNFVRPTPMTDALYEYSLSVGLREPTVFRELRDETGKLADGEMQIAPEQGPLLAMLVKMLGRNSVLKSVPSLATRRYGWRVYCLLMVS